MGNSKIALILGMDEYYYKDRDGLPALESLLACKKDAQEVTKKLSNLGYQIWKDVPIIGSHLNHEYGWADIRRHITDFFSSLKPGQLAVFYYSGHGIPREDELYLATPQVNPREPLATGFALSNLADLMKSSRATHIVSIVDACYSGAANLPAGTVRVGKAASYAVADIANSTYDKVLDKIEKGEGRYLMLSSQAYQPSLAGQMNSLYTKYLLEGLDGVKTTINEGIKIPGSLDEGDVTPESLHDFITFRILSVSDQRPKLKVDVSSRVVLASYVQDSSGSQPISAKQSKGELEYCIARGNTFFDMGYYAGALEFYDRALAINGDDVRAWNAKGNIQYKLENFLEALRCYDEALFRDPKNATSWYNKGNTFSMLKRYEAALECFDKAIDINPMKSHFWNNKGFALNRLSRREEANRCFLKARELESR